MMRKKLAAILVTMLIVGACSTIDVTYDYDKTVDFTKYKTFSFYGWAKESNKILTPFDQERIEKAFGEEFAARGLTYVKEGGDLTVVLFITTEEKQETTATTNTYGGYYGGYAGYYGWGPRWGWGPGYMGTTQSTTTYQTTNYTVGTLVVDVFDTNKKELIWESIGKGVVDEDASNRDVSIPKTVKKIMATYPVEPIEEKK
jgi:hypothetical protein